MSELKAEDLKYVSKAVAEQAALRAQQAQVDTGDVPIELVRQNKAGKILDPSVLGVTAMAASSEANLDPLSNNLQNLNADKFGGLSLGLYHMSDTQKTLPEFLKATGYAKEFKGIDPTKEPEKFAKRWADVGKRVGEEKFAEDQREFMLNDWSQMRGAREILKQGGVEFETLPDPLKSLVFSSTVALGARGMKDVMKYVDSSAGPTQMAAQLTAGRYARWASRPNASKHIHGWTNRAIREFNQTYKKLNDGASPSLEEKAFLKQTLSEIAAKNNVYNKKVKSAIEGF